MKIISAEDKFAQPLATEAGALEVKKTTASPAKTLELVLVSTLQTRKGLMPGLSGIFRNGRISVNCMKWKALTPYACWNTKIS